jgi:hypothetical protein
MRRRTVEKKVVFLDVLAVIPLLISQAEHALFEDRVLGIPQGHGQTEVLLVITKAPHAVFVPAIRPAAGMIVGEIVEGSRYFYTTPDRGIAASLQDLTRLFTGKPACEAWSKGIAGV